MKSMNKKLLFSIGVLIWLFFAVSAHAETENIEKTFSVEKGGTLDLESDLGSITVETWDKGEVSISVKKRARSRKRLDRFEVRIEQKGNDIYIEGENEWSNPVQVVFNVKIPEEYNVDLKTGGGSIDVADINGNVKLHTSGGSISVGNVSGGDINAHTSGGSIKIEDVKGNVKADTSGGGISIGNVDGGNIDAHTSGGSIKTGNVSGDLKVNTAGGSIHLGKITGTSSIHTSGGSISVAEGGGDLKAHTSGGSINIGPSEGNVKVSTSGGGINIGMTRGDVDADTSGGPVSVAGSRGKVRIKSSGGSLFVGSSEGPVRADTSGGNIRILQAKGAIDAKTSGGSIEAWMVQTDNSKDTHVTLHSSGGPITVYLPETIKATVSASLKISLFATRDYRIYSDFPLSINDDDRRITAKGDINGGGDRIQISTTNGDIHIKKLEE